MPNLTSVGIASGIPNSGTGNVSTIDALMADGGQATLGAKADAANVATDTTAVSGISIWKQISKSVQAIAASVAGSLAVTGTFWQATQPVSAASLPLPAGAALETGGNLAAILAACQAATPAGTNTIGAALGVTTKVSVTPTVTAATYALGKCVGGIMSFANILPASLGAVLESITLKLKGSVQTVGFWVAIFDTSPTGAFTDTTTAAIASTDTAFLVGLYHLTTPSSVLGTHTVYNLDGIGKAIVGASTGLFVVVVPDALTAALGSTADMTVQLGTLWG